jgi:hypothetical protein
MDPDVSLSTDDDGSESAKVENEKGTQGTKEIDDTPGITGAVLLRNGRTFVFFAGSYKLFCNFVMDIRDGIHQMLLLLLYYCSIVKSNIALKNGLTAD